jgi:WD40 repeat protein
VVSATPKRTAQVWDLRTGAVERDLIGHVGNVITARWSADASFIATTAMDGTARVWDASNGQQLAVFAHGDRWVVDADFSPDMSRLVISGSSGLAEIWDLPVLDMSDAELERIVRCRAPYDTEGDEIVPRRSEPSDCAAR